jgi:hypothetical protein
MHLQLSRSCIQYISIAKKDPLAEESFWETRDLLHSEFPFLDYASKSWVRHAKFAEVKGIDATILLDDLGWPSDNILRQWVFVSHRLEPVVVRPPTLSSTIIHITAQHCLISVLMAILKAEHIDVDIDPKDNFGWTPLSLAAEKGHEAVVKPLLATGKVDVNNSKDDNISHRDITRVVFGGCRCQAESNIKEISYRELNPITISPPKGKSTMARQVSLLQY